MSMTCGMAKELAPKIRVDALCPGMINTGFHSLSTKSEVGTAVTGSTPLKREGSAEEIAELAVFLASDAASFITGANVEINGGILHSRSVQRIASASGPTPPCRPGPQLT